jgi:hypothetical protein
MMALSGANAQTITGSIAGTVMDKSGLAVANANVTLIQPSTGAQRRTQTGITGDLVFNVLEPGVYELSVEAAGFKKFQRTAINLTASDSLSLGTITLEVGSVAESVTVRGQGAAVQTASTEHSGVLTDSQVQDLLIKGRNVITLLQLLPGVVDTNAPDAPDRNFAIGLSVNGGRRNSINLTIDGVGTQDSGTGWINTANISMDAIAEVKVLLNNFQAEYGRARGASVQLVGKSGTREFHGSFSYFKRNEEFNANDFFNTRLGLPKARYRYSMFSYTIGGPVSIPHHVNKDKNKLFFFWSQEFWPQQTAVPVTYVNMPTALERSGNFSQTVDVNNKPIVMKDPITGQPFPGNIVPSNRIDPNGQAILYLLPLPNFTNRAISGGQYNYIAQPTLDKPQHLSSMKIDFDPTSGNVFSVTWSRQVDTQTGTMGLATPNSNWPAEYRTWSSHGNIVAARYTRIFSPTAVNEFVFGHNRRVESEAVPPSQVASLSRSGSGYNAPQVFPGSNPMNLIPNVTFGGIPNTANITLTNFPLTQSYPTYTVTDNFTKTLSHHILKAGFFLDHAGFHDLAISDRGALNFATDVNNPLDTGYTYGNALLGVFSSSAQANRVVPHPEYCPSYEWFVQDSWKVSRRLTLELGVRFVLEPPNQITSVAAMFSPAAWDPSKKVQLITPTLVNGQRMGIDSLTGITYPAVTIGQITPSTSVNFANGMIVSNTSGVPSGLIQGHGVYPNPRFGFAWDVFGTGKTALRGGFGSFQSSGPSGDGNPWLYNAAQSIPITETVTVPYSTLASLRSVSGLISPSAVTNRQSPMGLGTSYNMNLGVQQQVGFGTVVEVGYVGTLGRHLEWVFDLDPIPLGADFNPKNADPGNSKVPLPANFLRGPYYGFSGVTSYNWGATSNYNALQVTANRRFARSLQFGVSWTWSRYLDSADFDNTAVSPFVPARAWNYGPSSMDRTHNLRMSWLYDLPKSKWNNPASRLILDGWQFSGINSFISGAPANVAFTTTNNADITGTASATAHVNLTCSPSLPKSSRTFYSFFNTSCFQEPAVGTLGDPAHAYLRGPGINNWDLSFFRNFPIRERMRLQLRLEMYNAFNHTQFSGVDFTSRFDPTGKQVNPTFGQINASRTPRQMQLALRFNF